ncbi:Riboflavin kinase [Coniochaeta hoffmannii]|uniref:Riboflavin kinase n=1 Tax=Coniochaeta hoffmannii TaxID=91930 RepID=A0AA38SMN8_9PEZI|nr:Riboflavin kinase [Coniochaeta hoffmannii]
MSTPTTHYQSPEIIEEVHTPLYLQQASSRPALVGDPSGPSPPFPLLMSGRVLSGFGRGSKDLGIPTANLPVDGPEAASWIADAKSGVYFGWAALQLPDEGSTWEEGGKKWRVWPMVMSIGYNPFYKNTVRSAEVHVMRRIHFDFRGHEMRLMILGYIREEKDYPSMEALIEDIKIDRDVARRSLERPGWMPREVGPEGTLDGSWLVRPEEEGVEVEVKAKQA